MRNNRGGPPRRGNDNRPAQGRGRPGSSSGPASEQRRGAEGARRRGPGAPAQQRAESHQGRDERPRSRYGLDDPPRARPAGPRPPARPQHFDKPPLSPQVTTLWDYPSQHYGDGQQGDKNYEGATPSYVIWNVVSRYSDPGALVLDPFCGSGTTLDVCKDLGRTGRGFDLAPTRPDITQGDARSLPIKSRTVDLVFMDPPYADNLAYSDDARCIGKLPADGRYQRAMRLVIAEAARVLKPEGVLAIYVCDVLKKGRTFHALGFEIFGMTGEEFLPIDVVSVVRHNRTLQMGNYRKAADEQGFFLRGFNYLMLFRRRSARE